MGGSPAEIVVDLDPAHRASLAAALDHGMLVNTRRLYDLARLMNYAGDDATGIADRCLERVGRIMRGVAVDPAPFTGQIEFAVVAHRPPPFVPPRWASSMPRSYDQGK